MDYRRLVELAFEIKDRAYAPYSGFKSGCAVLCDDGEIFVGCNMEIASFVPSVSSCQSAFVNAITNGEKDFRAIAIVGGNEDEINYCPPDGVARQVIEEFCGNKNFDVILAKNVNDYVVYSFDDLYPVPFGKKNLID